MSSEFPRAGDWVKAPDRDRVGIVMRRSGDLADVLFGSEGKHTYAVSQLRPAARPLPNTVTPPESSAPEPGVTPVGRPGAIRPPFEVGERIRLKSNPQRQGIFVSHRETRYGIECRVMFDGEYGTVEVPLQDIERVAPFPGPGWEVIDRDEFLTWLLLGKRDHKFTDVLYAYRGSRTKFEPHQFKPIFKLLNSPTPTRGLLLADEVGLGKTIEAAIVYLELQARGALGRVLVVCPAGLRHK